MAKNNQPRNWILVLIASLVIALSLLAVIVCAINIANLAWLGWLLIVGGISSIVLSTMAIIKNDPAWLLINLILPN